jgi:hypothetical protein
MEFLYRGHQGQARVTASRVAQPTTEYELELACKEVRRQASRSKLQLVRLAGEQASAFRCVLPLCRGLR